MKNHTPGPWKVLKESAPGRICIRAESGRLITWAIDLEPSGENQANATLIAAAPDLLETLVTLENAARPNLDPQKLEFARNEAHAVIALARGKKL